MLKELLAIEERFLKVLEAIPPSEFKRNARLRSSTITIITMMKKISGSIRFLKEAKRE
jgi:hypothetical protein